jgi:hypothetical protein
MLQNLKERDHLRVQTPNVEVEKLTLLLHTIKDAEV